MKLITVGIIVLVWFLNLSSNVVKTSEVTQKSGEFFIGGIINDWNLKHNGSNVVVLIDVGAKHEVTDIVISKIPKENSIIVTDPKKCENLYRSKAEFVIIVSDIYEVVS